MWKVCHSELVFSRRHSSTEPSFIVTAMWPGSNVRPLILKAVPMFMASGVSENVIVRRRSTWRARRSTGAPSGPRGRRSAAGRPADTTVRTIWLGVGPPPFEVRSGWSPPGNWANGTAVIG